jgi:uncharacterized damage-inducible protein DinB
MELRKLEIPSEYDPTNQYIVSMFAAQLDNQLMKLKKDLTNLTITQLEWQLHPGMNTIGMILVHLAIVEVFWINLVSHAIPETEWDSNLEKLINIKGDHDGMPIQADAFHPLTLKNYTLDNYLTLMDKARKTIHQEMLTWKDNDLESTSELQKKRFTRSWILYHVLEHFAGHYGQILLLKHLMGDAGVLEKIK